MKNPARRSGGEETHQGIWEAPGLCMEGARGPAAQQDGAPFEAYRSFKEREISMIGIGRNTDLVSAGMKLGSQITVAEQAPLGYSAVSVHVAQQDRAQDS